MKPQKVTEKKLLINRLHASHKLLVCLALSVAVFFIFPFKNIDALTHLMICWDIFSLGLLIMEWSIFFKTPQAQIRLQAKAEDESRIVIFIIVLVSTFVSLLAVILMLVTKSESSAIKALHLFVALAAMIFSWILVHTIFTVRYAHIYYDDDEAQSGTHAGGLNFPGEKKPDFLDFAYFAFVLGMAFQVSDVEVTSKRLRRLVLLHGLLSFGFNTAIVALTINIIAGLSNP